MECKRRGLKRGYKNCSNVTNGNTSVRYYQSHSSGGLCSAIF